MYYVWAVFLMLMLPLDFVPLPPAPTIYLFQTVCSGLQQSLNHPLLQDLCRITKSIHSNRIAAMSGLARGHAPQQEHCLHTVIRKESMLSTSFK